MLEEIATAHSKGCRVKSSSKGKKKDAVIEIIKTAFNEDDHNSKFALNILIPESNKMK